MFSSTTRAYKNIICTHLTFNPFEGLILQLEIFLCFSTNSFKNFDNRVLFQLAKILDHKNRILSGSQNLIRCHKFCFDFNFFIFFYLFCNAIEFILKTTLFPLAVIFSAVSNSCDSQFPQSENRGFQFLKLETGHYPRKDNGGQNLRNPYFLG